MCLFNSKVATRDEEEEVFDNVCQLFGETIRNMVGCDCSLLLNVMEVFSVGGGALLDRRCMVFQRMCVLCL